MREFGFEIKEALVNGLLPDPRLPINAPYLETLYNMKPSPMGLVRIDTATNASIGGSPGHTPTTDMRYLAGGTPLIIDYTSTNLALKELTIAIGDTPTYTATTQFDGAGSLTAGQFIRGYDGAGSVTIQDDDGTSPHNWQYIERDGIWIIANSFALITNCGIFGNGTVFAASVRDDPGGATYDGIVPSGVTMLGDRLVLAGLDTSGGTKFGEARFDNMWEAFKTYSEQVGITRENDVCNNQWVMIGTPGGGSSDIPFALEMSVLMGHRSQFHNMAVEAAARGEITFCRIPWKGSIYGVRAIGNNVMVYGSDGVGIMTRVPSGEGSMPGYVIKQLHEVGLLGPSSHAGDEFQQIFIDGRGDIFRVNAEGQISKAGYRKYIHPTTGNLQCEEISISYDPREGDYYISDESNCFVLTPTGLAKARHLVRTIIPDHIGLYGSVPSSGGAAAYFVTHPINMKSRQIKLIGNMSLEYRDCTSVTMQVKTRYGASGEYTNNSDVAINLEGEVFAALQGSDFKFQVDMTPSTDITDDPTVDELRVRWKATDKRYLRGLNT